MANTETLSDDELSHDDETAGQVGSDGDAIRKASDASWMTRVAAERDDRLSTEDLHLGMPTWGPPEFPSLVVTYGVVSRPELERFQRQSQQKKRKGKTGASDTDIDFLIRAARKVWIRNPEDDRLYLVPDARLDVKLSRALGVEDKASNSRELLLYLVKSNGVALGNLALKVAQWMTNTSAEVADEVLEDELLSGQ